MNIRIVQRLDIKARSLVEGVHVEGLCVLGQRDRFGRHYYEQGTDERI